MYEQIFSIAAICLIAAAGACWSAVRKRSLKRQRLHEKYGKIPETGDWDKEEQVKNYYEWMKKKESGDWVDDITWSDLSMNLIFQRINVCDTSAGEEILYWRLRKNSVAPGEGQELEQRIRTFSDNEQEREDVEKLLCRIGKSASSYYIPAYMETVEEYKIGFQWLFRGLQILLAACAVLALVLTDSRFGFAMLGVAAVNLLVYTYFKLKFEIEIGMSGTAVSMLEWGREIAGRKEIQALYPDLKKEISYFRDVLRGSRFLQANRISMATGDMTGVILDYLLGTTLCRLTSYNKMIDRMSRKSGRYMEIYRQIGELDAAVSIASFRASLPVYCVPEFGDGKHIYMEEVCHPAPPFHLRKQ